MHYCFGIITENYPTDEVIADVLRPYKYNDFKRYHPGLEWDWYVIGGRYGGLIKLSCDDSHGNSDYQWDICITGIRTGRLFRSRFLESYYKMREKAKTIVERIDYLEENYAFRYLGFREGYIYVDGAKIKDILNLDDLLINHGFGLIDSDCKVHVRDSWNGEEWKKDEDYDEKMKRILKNINPEHYLCYVDIHI